MSQLRQSHQARSFAQGALIFARAVKEPARIALINGHPDPRPERFCAALCRSYASGAAAAGLETRELAIGAVSDTSLAAAFEVLDWANRFTVVFPLWLDQPPAALKSLFAAWTRHALDAGFVEPRARKARFVIAMAMPAFAHRALSQRDSAMVSIPGIFRADLTYVGSVETISAERRASWLEDLRRMGARGD